MKPLFSVFVLALLILIPNSAFSSSEYKLGSGDVINIVVYGESDLSLNQIQIPPQGKISFPLLGVINISGLTTRKLEKYLHRKLRKGYLKKPNVSVIIDQYRPFFVNGQVRSPGAFPYIDGLTVQKAISIAGGLNERASISKISLIRDRDGKESNTTNLNQAVKPGDILLVGESLF